MPGTWVCRAGRGAARRAMPAAGDMPAARVTSRLCVFSKAFQGAVEAVQQCSVKHEICTSQWGGHAAQPRLAAMQQSVPIAGVLGHHAPRNSGKLRGRAGHRQLSVAVKGGASIWDGLLCFYGKWLPAAGAAPSSDIAACHEGRAGRGAAQRASPGGPRKQDALCCS